MTDSTPLFSWETHVDQRTLRPRTLVVTLGSYTDAGHTQRLVDAHLLNSLPNRIIGRFDADQVVDYAGRRPMITFDADHFTEYERPEINLHLVTDRDGTDFLLLNGPEPSLRWEAMAAGVRQIVEQLDVPRTVVLQSIPAPAPHTRPVAVTRFASDPELVKDEVPMLGTFSLSANFDGVLTLRLGEAGHDVLGLVAHVPHYIAENDYPAAALALLEALRSGAHLAVPTDGLDLSAGMVRAQIDNHIAGNEELETMVAALENGYDQFMSERDLRNAQNAQLPSADEIGQQVEEFLAELHEHTPEPTTDHDDDPDADGPAEQG